MTWVPESCTLPTADRPLRVAEFDALFAAAVCPTQRRGATRLRIRLPAGDAVVAAARELIAREASCCSFLTFTVRPTGTATVLDVAVPRSQRAVLDAIQERADAAREGERS
jgi:hypothetical protein